MEAAGLLDTFAFEEKEITGSFMLRFFAAETAGAFEEEINQFFFLAEGNPNLVPPDESENSQYVLILARMEARTGKRKLRHCDICQHQRVTL